MTRPTECTDGDEDGFTELRDARFSRIDLVGKGANGYPVLIAKADPAGAGIPPDVVRRLLEGGTGMRGTVAKTKQPKGRVAVFDANGKLVGLVDETKINPVREVSDGQDDPPPAALKPAHQVQVTPAAGDTLAPAPSASAGIPADVAKARRGARPIVGNRHVAAAVDAVRQAVTRGDTPAGVELVRLHAARRAADGIARDRAQARRR